MVLYLVRQSFCSIIRCLTKPCHEQTLPANEHGVHEKDKYFQDRSLVSQELLLQIGDRLQTLQFASPISLCPIHVPQSLQQANQAIQDLLEDHPAFQNLLMISKCLFQRIVATSCLQRLSQ